MSGTRCSAMKQLPFPFPNSVFQLLLYTVKHFGYIKDHNFRNVVLQNGLLNGPPSYLDYNCCVPRTVSAFTY